MREEGEQKNLPGRKVFLNIVCYLTGFYSLKIAPVLADVTILAYLPR